MKASPWEEQDALHEGIPILNHHVPVPFEHEPLRLTGMRFQIVRSERDLVTRVLAKALDPAATPVSKMMTAHPHCITPESKVADAVLRMIKRGFRYLPVVAAESGCILGVFSACSRRATRCRAK